eukprot:6009793-Karenia_brevis.AAC.1
MSASSTDIAIQSRMVKCVNCRLQQSMDDCYKCVEGKPDCEGAIFRCKPCNRVNSMMTPMRDAHETT